MEVGACGLLTSQDRKSVALVEGGGLGPCRIIDKKYTEPARARVVSSGLAAAGRRESGGPGGGWWVEVTACGLRTSHNRTVLSQLAEARVLPSGLNATLYTEPVWPVRGWPIEVGACLLLTS